MKCFLRIPIAQCSSLGDNEPLQFISNILRYLREVYTEDCLDILRIMVPPEEAGIDWRLIQRFFTKTLFKQFSKTDKVTVIGSCVEPWLARSNQVLKQFPTVVLLPNTSHGTVAHILKEWVLSHTVIPADFEVTCLAQVLRGYSFGYLKEMLKKFLTAETIISIAARGLSPMDVYNFVIQDATEDKIDYDKYLSWYKETTVWGRKEQKHREKQLEFKRALAEFALRAEKKKKANQTT